MIKLYLYIHTAIVKYIMTEIIYNIIGGIVVAILTYLYIRFGHFATNWYIRKLFGNDLRNDKIYHIAYAQLKLKDSLAESETYPYKKSDKQDSDNGFSIENPISGCEVRAIKYLSSLFGKHRVSAPRIIPDTDIKDKLDLSFIALGGALSNYKTNDVQDNLYNSLVKIITIGNQAFFVTTNDEKLIMEYEQGFDYGLILRIRPSEFPEKVWIVCAGFGEWGTSGAAYYLCRRWKELIRKNQKWHNLCGLRKDTNFAAIIKVERDRDESAKLVKLYRDQEDIDAIKANLKPLAKQLSEAMSTTSPPTSASGTASGVGPKE